MSTNTYFLNVTYENITICHVVNNDKCDSTLNILNADMKS